MGVSFLGHFFSLNPQSLLGNSKQGLRCKTCKVSVHLWCSEEISHQQCPGKTVSERCHVVEWLNGGGSRLVPPEGWPQVWA